MQAIPALFEKRDIISCAETGSGKSLAFIIPLLSLIKRGNEEGLKAIVLVPTRELAIQLYKEFLLWSAGGKHEELPRVRFFRKALVPKTDVQCKKLLSMTEILITTPLKFSQTVESIDMKLQTVEFLVMDESDKLFEMGFLEQIDSILQKCTNPTLHKSMFSATMPPQIEEMIRSFMHDALKINIGIRNTTAHSVNQKLVYVGKEEGKLIALRELFKNGFIPPLLIFVQSKQRAKELFHELIYDNVNVNTIHADKSKIERDEIVKQFRLGKIWVLVCTDLMARGIDFKKVNCVINYDFPQTTISYIHRIGRTGRAGEKGEAVTFFTDEDSTVLKTIANVMNKSGCEVPEWMLRLKAPTKFEKRSFEKRPPRRRQISTDVKRNVNKKFQKHMEKMESRRQRVVAYSLRK